VPNPGHRLTDGMFARVQLVTAQHAGALLAPRAAVLVETAADGATSSVLRLDKDGTVHKVEVQTGLVEDDTIEILSGLKAGDRVVTTGAYGLADGAKVTVGSGEKEAP